MIFINQEIYQNLIGVYKITNLVTSRIYIGSSTTGFIDRFYCHLYLLDKNEHNRKFQDAFSKYGKENFTFEVLEICQNTEDCIPCEQLYLDTLLFAQEYILSNDFRFHQLGYNICPTAGNTLGRKHTEESKKKMKEIQIQYHLDHPEFAEEQRKRMIKFFKENPNAIEEHRVKLIKFYEENPNAKILAREKAINYSLEHPEKIENHKEFMKSYCTTERNRQNSERKLKYYQTVPFAKERVGQIVRSRPILICECGQEIRGGQGNLKQHQRSTKCLLNQINNI